MEPILIRFLVMTTVALRTRYTLIPDFANIWRFYCHGFSIAELWNRYLECTILNRMAYNKKITLKVYIYSIVDVTYCVISNKDLTSV